MHVYLACGLVLVALVFDVLDGRIARCVASGTVETRQAMADRVFDTLQLFFAEGRMLSAASAD